MSFRLALCAMAEPEDGRQFRCMADQTGLIRVPERSAALSSRNVVALVAPPRLPYPRDREVQLMPRVYGRLMVKVISASS